jgi:hypothetical protein
MAASTDTLLCPRCRRPVDAERSGPAGRTRENCPSCGLIQTGEHVGRLRAVVARLDTIARAQYALTAEATALRAEQAELLRVLGTGAPARPRRSAPESRPEVVRDVLLWLGSALVAVAALIFALFAWRRLGDTGRAGLLFAMTFLAAGAAYGLHKRLPATAEALGGLTLALFLVDWFVLRKGGAGAGLSVETWWAMGTGMAAGLSVAAAPWLRLQAVAAAVLAQVSAVLVVTRLDADWTVALGLALVAAPLAAVAGLLSRDREWTPAAVVLACGVALMEVAALMLVEDLFVLGDGATSVRLAAVLLAMALAPAGALWTAGAGSLARRNTLVAAGAASVLGAVAMLAAAVWTTPASLLAAVAVLGAGGVALALVLPAEVRAGSLYAAGAALSVGVLRLLEPVAAAAATPLSWLSDVWGGSLGDGAVTHAFAFDAAIVALLALAGAAGLVLVRGRGLVPAPLAWGAAAAAMVGLVVTAPLAAGSPIWAATLVTAAGALAAMGAASLADRRGWRLPAGALAAGAAVLGATAAGWAAATEAGTVTFLAFVAAGAAAATAAARTAAFRQALGALAATAAAGEGAAIAVSAGAATAHAGVVMARVGGAALVAGALWRHRAAEGVALEAVGAGALVLGAGLAAGEEPWLAVVLTAAVAWLMVAGTSPARRLWLAAGAGTAVAATWAWLATFDVGLVEAYTLPAAAVALAAGVVARAAPGAGWVARRRNTTVDSWAAFAPGLGIGLLPSVALVVIDGGLARPLAVTLAALVVLLAGAQTRLQAPMVLGAGALLVVGLDALWPVAARVPRWAAIGTVGLTLLWLGATAEHRLAQLKELGRRFRDLEPDGPMGQSV